VPPAPEQLSLAADVDGGSTARPSRTLGELCELPIDQRYEYVAGFDVRSLGKACAEDVLHPRCAEAGFAERVAWGIAFNMRDETPESAGQPADRRRRTYLDRWGAHVPWSEIWAKLSARDEPNATAAVAPASLLHDLAKAISCEHRSDWQHPGHRPVDPKVAGAAFGRLYGRHMAFVLSVVREQVADTGGDEEDIAREVFVRAFQTYWSAESRTRFLGTARISTVLHKIAERACIDDLRQRKRRSAEPLPEEDLPAGGEVYTEAEGAELRQKLRQVLRRVPPKQRLVYYLVSRRQMSQREVASRLGVTAANVSQLFSTAKQAVESGLAGLLER
jgi:RNA polymerase sigma factor (sigma-70 family)